MWASPVYVLIPGSDFRWRWHVDPRSTASTLKSSLVLRSRIDDATSGQYCTISTARQHWVSYIYVILVRIVNWLQRSPCTRYLFEVIWFSNGLVNFLIYFFSRLVLFSIFRYSRNFSSTIILILSRFINFLFVSYIFYISIFLIYSIILIISYLFLLFRF